MKARDYELKKGGKTAASPKENADQKKGLTLALDVGHSSIGWALFRGDDPAGCGVVTFPADDCLASKRRTYRRQRRHVRSTRQRIARMEKLLVQQGIFTAKQIEAMHEQGGGHNAPWLLAARLLNAKDGKPHLLEWRQLWDVLRWYAHNRGYNANKLWSKREEDDAEDTEKLANARKLMGETHRETMAETITDFMFRPFPAAKPYGAEMPALPFFTSKSRYKAQNCAFPREVIEKEARRILEAHCGHLKGCDAALISALMDDWRALPCEGVKLPSRYHGGILFGQLIPRFDNRIISTCSYTGGKVATKSSFEFLRYRWAMQMMGVQVQDGVTGKMRVLDKDERAKLTAVIQARGYLTDGELKKSVREITGCKHDNLEALLLHPDAKEALQLIPIATGKEAFRAVWAALNNKWRNIFAIQLQRGKVLTPQRVLDVLAAKKADDVVAAVAATVREASLKKGRYDEEVHAALLAEEFKWKSPRGRAPFARNHLVKAWEEVMAGLNPRKKCKGSDKDGGEDKPQDGCLVATEEMQKTALAKPLDAQTNNHLVRHRLLILERLARDIAADEKLTGGEKIAQVVIEVNRDLKEMSGKTAKEKAQEMGQKLANFKGVVEYLEKHLDTKKHPITPGLIRKARVAMDLDWFDPYTGRKFDPIDLATRAYDKDHIIPYSQRPSNSLDSLVMTTGPINKEKANRTAIEFIECINQPENLAKRDKLGVWSVKQYHDFVEKLNLKGSHDDDKKRKRRRQALMLLPKWDDKNGGFLPRDLTVTSQLTRLGAQSVRRVLSHLQPHEVVSIPGSVTGVLRTGWRLLGCLAQANPLVKDENDTNGVKTKTEIRDITHLHHALDACVLALTAHYIPKNGAFWEAVVKRTNTPEEKALLKATGIFAEAADGKLFLKKDLPEGLKEKISAKLCEKRVVQHVPRDMGGMKVEENTRRIAVVSADGKAKLRQHSRDPKTQKLSIKPTEERADKLVGLRDGKLKKQKGARVITDNFGVAILDHLPEGADEQERFVIIPWHRVWGRVRELAARNQGKPPVILRQGSLIEVLGGGWKGVWRVLSVKNTVAYGKALDLAEVDSDTLSRPNAPLGKMHPQGIRPLSCSLTGLDVSQVEYAVVRRKAKKSSRDKSQE